MEQKEMQGLENNMGRYWSHRAQSYQAMVTEQLESRTREAWEEAIFAGVDESRPLDILDIGTGPGFFAMLAGLRGHRVTAVDMNGEMLQRAKESAGALGLDIQFLQVGHQLPFSPGSFDLIVCRDVTWTLTEPEEQMKGWASLLKPQGILRYFDTEWYQYLSRERRADYTGTTGALWYERASEMEQIAAGLPMTYRPRPSWDQDFWQQAGYTCLVEENLNERVYGEKERRKYQQFPCFSVTVRGAVS